MLFSFMRFCAVLFVLLFQFSSFAFDQSLDLPVEKPGPRPAPTVPNQPPTGPTPSWGDDPMTIYEEPQKPPTIFGTEVKSENGTIYYVIDISGSMGLDVNPFTDENGATKFGNRLDRAKTELTKSILSLPDTFKFNILAYDCSVRIWKSELTIADAANKANAIGWVQQLQPGGATGTGEATAMALLSAKENKLVVLLTDGDPNCHIGGANGGMQIADEHRQTIKAANTQGAIINVYGIQAYGAFRQFCVNVASDNNGTYMDVE